MSTPTEMNTGLDVVIPIVLVAIVLVLLAIPFQRFLVAVADELVELYRTYGHVAANKALDRRHGLPQSPWFCARCSSRNGLAAKVCYKCAGRREDCELQVADAEVPAGPSAGLNVRTRNRTGSGTTTGTGIDTGDR